MTAAEFLRRAERRQRWSRILFITLGAFMLAGTFSGAVLFIHRDGIAEGRALEKRMAFEKALKNNAEKLRLAGLHRDTTKKEVKTAIDAATVHRDSSRETVASVTPTSDTTLQVATLPPIVLPKLAIDAFRDLRVGRLRDSLAVVKLEEDIGALEVENFLLADRVATYEQHEADHANEVRAAGRRGLKKGAVLGGLGVLLLGFIL